jgi:hypothetical protein
MSSKNKIVGNHNYILTKLEVIKEGVKEITSNKHLKKHCMAMGDSSLISSSVLMGRLNQAESRTEESLAEISSITQEMLCSVEQGYLAILDSVGIFHSNLMKSDLYIIAMTTEFQQDEDDLMLKDIDSQFRKSIYDAKNFL